MKRGYWRERLCVEERPSRAVAVIFGASGDLAAKKLFPAIEALQQNHLLHAETKIFACSRHRPLAALPDGVEHLGFDYDSDAAYQALAEKLSAYRQWPVLFYPALPGAIVSTVVEHLADAGLLAEQTPEAWRHVIFEKPFGFDLAGAEALDEFLHRHLTEEQIYRIDHYLGKETVQNILMLRFGNVVFEPLWNRNWIECVKIVVSERFGVGARAGYYDRAGHLRDMFQNHMLEMLALVAMELPRSFAPDSVRDEKRKLVESIRPFTPENIPSRIQRGQYAGYRSEPGIPSDSMTETFVRAHLAIDSWRWEGVPFCLISGKKLAKTESRIEVVFRKVPHSIFSPLSAGDLQNPKLIFKVQPEEGLTLTLNAKHPGPRLCMGEIDLDYDYGQMTGESGSVKLSAYARLLLDALAGDQTLFIRSDEIASAWRLWEPVLDFWRDQPERCPMKFYEDNRDLLNP
ncbi:MAG: glucose-6-phosphate dehydrogenase [Victivallaceae bacterium]|nr:glucose-6-phosphate dehydrogenase [Victivallaceae bacterium]